VGNLPAALGPCAGPPRRAPGASFAYNNCDYFVLGAVLERLTGRSYADLVRERLDGLGARSVRVAGTATSAPAILGYMADGSPEPPIELATYGAAGAISGTARDLLAFDRALVAHRLVSPAATAEMWRGDPRLGYAALGAWAFSATLPGCSRAVSLIERRGAILGVQVRNFIAPELGRAVIVFANDAGVAFGEVWQGRGLSHALLAAALCEPEE
jgi:CubicO group peptidase (beta-lactamase class C family)